MNSSKLDERDQYSVFFGGNMQDRYPVNTDRKTQTSGVQRFIWANCFLPLLAPYYREIVVIDPRYYTGK